MKDKNMSDDLTKKGEPDRSKINVHEPWELEYWHKKFNCTPQELRDAVKEVGVSVEKVSKYLGK